MLVLILLNSLEVIAFAFGFGLPTLLYFVLILKDRREERKKVSLLLHDLNNSVHDLSMWLENNNHDENTQILEMTVSSLKKIVSQNFNPIENKINIEKENLSLEGFKNGIDFLVRRHLPHIDLEIIEEISINNNLVLSLIHI